MSSTASAAAASQDQPVIAHVRTRTYCQSALSLQGMESQVHLIQAVCYIEAGHQNQKIERQESTWSESSAIHLSYRIESQWCTEK